MAKTKNTAKPNPEEAIKSEQEYASADDITRLQDQVEDLNDKLLTLQESQYALVVDFPKGATLKLRLERIPALSFSGATKLTSGDAGTQIFIDHADEVALNKKKCYKVVWTQWKTEVPNAEVKITWVTERDKDKPYAATEPGKKDGGTLTKAKKESNCYCGVKDVIIQLVVKDADDKVVSGEIVYVECVACLKHDCPAGDGSKFEACKEKPKPKK